MSEDISEMLEGVTTDTEEQLRSFIEGAILADGFKAFLYQIARVCDRIAEDILHNSHGNYDLQAKAREYQQCAAMLWTVLHKARE